MISYVRSANSKLENKFSSINKISESVLIFGQLFLLLILSAGLLYSVKTISGPINLLNLLSVFDSVRLLFENSASGLFLLWVTAIFIDYIEKKNRD